MPTVTFDNVSNLGTSHSTSGFSGSYTLGASATGLLVAVGGCGTSMSSLTTRTCTVNGKPMRLLGAVNNANAANKGWTELWGLIGAPTGLVTIAVVENNGSTPAYLNVTAISMSGAGQFGNAVTNYGTAATTTSGAIVSATGNRVLTVTGAYDATLSAPSGTQRSDMPASPTVDYVTLLVQDAAGAATVTNTCTYAGPDGWGDVSVNVIAGNLWTVSAPLSLTVGEAAGGSFVGQVWTKSAQPTALATTASASVTAQAQGPPLRYVGRAPDSASVLGTTAYAQSADASNLVTPSWISQQVAQAASSLVTPEWVSEQAAAYLAQASVTSALSGYVANSLLGAANGVAQADPSGIVPSAQLPALTTNNVAMAYDCVNNGSLFLPTGTEQTVITENIGEFVLAEVVIPNPGYPYVALPFGWVLGYSGGTPSSSRLEGNGNVGFLAVTEPSEETPVYGMGLMTADTLPNYYSVLPAADGLATVNPTTQPPFQTGVTLQLSACNYAGSDYVVSGTGLIFFVLVFPALGA